MTSLFLPSGLSRGFPSAFSDAGLEINRDSAVRSDFACLFFEHTGAVDAVRSYMIQHNVPGPNLDLVDKNIAADLYRQAGFYVLPSIIPMSRSDIESFPADKVILKPMIGLAGRVVERSPVGQLAYAVVSKTTVLAVIDMDPTFFERQTSTSTQYVMQEGISYTDNQYEFVMISGAVNGNGELYLEPSIKSEWSYLNRKRTSIGTCSTENDTEEMGVQKQYFANLIQNCGVRNAICNVQMLRHTNGQLTPIDFQYRITYHVRFNTQDPAVAQYAVDLVKFAYDLSPDKPSFNFHTAVSVTKPDGPEMVKASVGSTRQEALSKL